MNDNTIPLSHLALEIDASADELAERLGDRVAVDDIGRRCVDRTLAGVMIAAYHAEKQAQQEREQRRNEQAAARRQVMARQHQQLLDRVKAVQMRQQIDVDGDLSKSALATMTADDLESKLARSSNRMDDFLGGGFTRHPLTDKEH